MRKDEGTTRILPPLTAYDTPARPNPLAKGKYKNAHISLFHTHFSTLHINFLTIPSKMALRQRSVSSSANPKKLIRPQRTVKPTSGDVYDITLNSDGSNSIDRDDSFRSYIAREAEEILDDASDKGCAKDVESQVRSHVYLVFDAKLTT
jgi:hypothetical protein